MPAHVITNVSYTSRKLNIIIIVLVHWLLWIMRPLEVRSVETPRTCQRSAPLLTARRMRGALVASSRDVRNTVTSIRKKHCGIKSGGIIYRTLVKQRGTYYSTSYIFRRNSLLLVTSRNTAVTVIRVFLWRCIISGISSTPCIPISNCHVSSDITNTLWRVINLLSLLVATVSACKERRDWKCRRSFWGSSFMHSEAALNARSHMRVTY